MVVVGSGVGGLCAAAHLGAFGYDVLVLEKNARPGGRCDRIVLDGHRFDTGPTLFVLPELYQAEFTALGADMHALLDLCRVDPTYQVVFEDGGILQMTGDQARMRAQLEELEFGAFNAFTRYMGEGRRHYERALNEFVRRDFRSVTELASPSNLAAMIELKLLVKHYRNVARYFKSPRLRAAFTFQDLYMGLSPADAPATFSMIPYSELTHGVWYPRGGLYRVVEVLRDMATERGVRFEFGAKVRRIVVERRRTTGVELESGEQLAAEVVLANADLPYVVDQLLPPSTSGRLISRRPLSFSSMSFFWTLRRRIDGLSPHNLLLADDYLEGFREVSAGRPIPSNPCVYLHAPTRIDESMAPPGRDTLIAVIPVGHMSGDTEADWSALRDRAREHVFRRLDRTGFVGVRESIIKEVAFTPPSWQRRYNLMGGASHGLGHQLWQLGGLRPHNRHPTYQNLYFAGASTHPGSGMPTAMVSGRLAAVRIRDDLQAVHGPSAT